MLMPLLAYAMQQLMRVNVHLLVVCARSAVIQAAWEKPRIDVVEFKDAMPEEQLGLQHIHCHVSADKAW